MLQILFIVVVVSSLDAGMLRAGQFVVVVAELSASAAAGLIPFYLPA